MIAPMAVGEARPGYELWRPNREKAEAITTKYVIVLLLLASAAIAGVVTITGFSLLQGGTGMGIACVLYVLLYVLFASCLGAGAAACCRSQPPSRSCS